MCDYGAFPLWSADGSVSLDPQTLPLSDATRDSLARWAESYDRLVATAFSWSDQGAAAFEAEGRRLWNRLRAELGTGWNVGYFSQQEDRALWPAGDAA